MILYHTLGSAPCRAVLLVAAALNIQLDLVNVNLMQKEQFKPEFLKSKILHLYRSRLNPQHTVPTLVDDGFSLWESRAIARYLVNKYGQHSTLYPEDPQTRAVVDQRLDFDLGTLYKAFSSYFYPQLFGGARPDKDLLNNLNTALEFLDKFLEDSEYAVGSNLTIADLSLVATVSTIDVAGVDLEPFPNVQRWYKLVKSTAPGYETANQPGLDSFKIMINKLKGKTEL